jgi:Rho-binding antiterminator
MKKDQVYQPISCSFYDRIEAAIVLRKIVTFRYQNDAGDEVSLQTRLLDTRIRDKAEYVVLPDQVEVRMDHILSLDGAPLPGSC